MALIQVSEFIIIYPDSSTSRKSQFYEQVSQNQKLFGSKSARPTRSCSKK